jgi:hypothetical protein
LEEKDSSQQEVIYNLISFSHESNDDFTTIIEMPSGTHHLKFIVDDEWKCSEDLPTASDMDGNLINYLQVSIEEGHSQGDGLDDLSHNFDEDAGKRYHAFLSSIYRNSGILGISSGILFNKCPKVSCLASVGESCWTREWSAPNASALSGKGVAKS